MLKFIKVAFCVVFSINLVAQQAENYAWKSVTINGGGYVPGFIFSKAEKDLLYARTDIGGAYRWDESAKKWIPLSDFITSSNQMGVISMAADPKDANRVYMVTGLYSNSWDPNGILYSSTDKGNTWTKIDVPFKVGGNESGRGSGERLMIDPNLPSKLVFGSQKQGLFISTNYGNNWTNVSTFPKSRINCVEIDPSSGAANTASKDIYIATTDNLTAKDTTVGGLYKSSDGGATWQYVAGQPVKIEPKDFDNPKISTPAIINNIAFAGDFIFFTYGNDLAPGCSNGFVMKYNKITKVWTKIFPFPKNTQGGYNSLAVHPTNPNIVVVGTLGYWWPTSDRIYLTKDGGSTWIDVRTKMKTNNKNTPHGGGMGWNSGLKINPFNPNHAVFGSGNGLWMTYNLDKSFVNDSTLWTYENDNFEETAVLALASPPSGAHLYSGLGDIKGFVHTDLSKSPANTYHQHGNTYSVDFAENTPSTIVRTHDGGNRASISTNSGVTWTDFATQAQGGNARSNYISISPDGKTIVWSPNDSIASYSTNAGASWTVCSGLANDVFPKSDRVNSSVFYAMNNANGEFLKSTDGAKNFTKVSTFSFVGGTAIVPVFGKEGHVWASAGSNGLHYSTNGGTSFTKITSVQDAYRVTFGKAAVGASYPTVFMYGKVNERVGLYRSNDMGATWTKINNQTQEFGRNHSVISGDPKVYGRLYIATHGRGIMYGDVQSTSLCLAPLLPQTLVLCENSYTQLAPQNSIDTTVYTFKWFKDGVNLNKATSSIQVSRAGNYSLTISKAGCPDASDFVNVVSQLMDVNNVAVCKGSTATLSVTGNSTYRWTDAAQQLLSTTNQLQVTPTASTVYYVSDTKTTPHAIGLATYASGGWGIGSQFDNNQNKIKLTVTQSIWLKGISLHVTGAGTNGVIRLLDKAGNVYISASKTGLPIGTQEIPFNVILKPGEYTIDAVGTTGSVQFQSDRTGVNWSVPNYVTMSSVPGWAYGIFFNLKFETGNTCAATPVEVKVNVPEAITYNYQINGGTWKKGTSTTLCAGDDMQFAAWPVSGSTWSWTGPNGFTSTVRNPLLANVTTIQMGVYNATQTDANGCKSSASFTIDPCVVTSSLELDQKDNYISVYPNPSQGTFLIKNDSDEVLEIIISNLKGREVYKNKVENVLLLNNELPSGIYILKILGKKMDILKIVIE